MYKKQENLWLWENTLEYEQNGSEAKIDTSRSYPTGVTTSTQGSAREGLFYQQVD